MMAEPGPQATCVDEGAYAGALTYGRRYEVLAAGLAGDRPKVKVRTDAGRVRWFPASCFDLAGREVARLASIDVRDDLAEAERSHIVVDLTMSDGSRRWCIFATPAALAASGDMVEGTGARVHYGAPHMIVATELSEDVIWRALRQIERQGMLADCTRAFEAAEQGQTRRDQC